MVVLALLVKVYSRTSDWISQRPSLSGAWNYFRVGRIFTVTLFYNVTFVIKLFLICIFKHKKASDNIQIVCALPLDVSTGGRGGSEVKKFEKVCSDGHQISLAGGSLRSHVWEESLSSYVWVAKAGTGSLYSEVQCIVGNGHIGMYDSITFLQLR